MPAALEEARARGWKLAILSNTDRDLLDASLARIGVEFDESDRRVRDRLVQAGAPRTGTSSSTSSGADRDRHVHVAASLFHDIAPASALGLRTVWINRLGEEAEPQPDVELAQPRPGSRESLDSLVPA